MSLCVVLLTMLVAIHGCATGVVAAGAVGVVVGVLLTTSAFIVKRGFEEKPPRPPLALPVDTDASDTNEYDYVYSHMVNRRPAANRTDNISDIFIFVTMEDAFEKLKRDGNNSVDNLIKWMKDSKLIDEAKAEDQARKLFEGINDTKNVELVKFKEVVAKLAADQKKNVDEFTKQLGEQGSKLLGAAMAGASAFKEALTKK